MSNKPQKQAENAMSKHIQLRPLAENHKTSHELMADFGSDAAIHNTYEMCRIISKTDMVPPTFRDQPQNIMVAGAFGAKLGLDMMQACRGLYVLKGQVGVWGDVLNGLIEGRSDLEFKYEQFAAIKWLKESNPEELKYYEETYGKYDPTKWQICIVKRENRGHYTGIYSMKEAEEGHKGKDSIHKFRKHPRRNLLRTARRHACYDAYPDVLTGLSSDYNDRAEMKNIAGDETDDTSWASEDIKSAVGEFKADFDGDDTNEKQMDKFKKAEEVQVEEVDEEEFADEPEETAEDKNTPEPEPDEFADDEGIAMDEFEDDVPPEVDDTPEPDEDVTEKASDKAMEMLSLLLDRLNSYDLDDIELKTQIQGPKIVQKIKEWKGKVESAIETGEISAPDAQTVVEKIGGRLDDLDNTLEEADEEQPF